MMPGSACGRTIFKMVSSLVAPSARLASRRPGGMAFNDSSVATMTTGTVITASVSEAQMSAGQPLTPRARESNEETEAEQTENDGRDAGKIIDGGADDARDKGIAGRVFRQVDRGDDANRDDENRHHQHAEGGANNHRQHAGGVDVEEIFFRDGRDEMPGKTLPAIRDNVDENRR